MMENTTQGTSGLTQEHLRCRLGDEIMCWWWRLLLIRNKEISARLRAAFLAQQVAPTRLLGSLEHVFDTRLSRLAFVALYRTFISVIGITSSTVWMLFFFQPAQAFEIEALVLDEDQGKKIEALWIDKTRTEVSFKTVENPEATPDEPALLDAAEVTVDIFGSVSDPASWNILYNNQLLKLGDSGKFALRLRLRREVEWFELSGIRNDGTVQTQRVGIQIKNHQEFLVYLRERRTPMRLAPSLGLSQLTYKQRNVAPLSELTVRADALVTYDLDPGLIEAHLEASYFYPITEPEPPVAKISYLTSSASLSAYLPDAWMPPRVRQSTLRGGFFLHHLTVDPRIFGYTSLGGIFAELFTAFDVGRAYDLDLTLRYGTLPWGGAVSDFLDRRILGATVGFARSFVTTGKIRVMIDVDQVNLASADVAVFIAGLRGSYVIQF